MPQFACPTLVLSALVFVLLPASLTHGDKGQTDATPYEDLFRLPIPDTLPDHPRVFCNKGDLARIQADYEAGDPYTTIVVDGLLRRARHLLERPPAADGTPDRGDFANAAALAQAWAVSGDERFGRRARGKLLWFADICPGLETTRSRGKFTDSTLSEGPIAVNAAMAYDLIAAAPFVTDADRRHIENDLLRELAWECGHRCHHANSSNWRSWALAIIASCGFAAGDRDLINEAINGAWDPDRNLYLYGIVQQITHSVFSDGIHWERSMGYQSYTASALMYVLEAAKNSGIDIWHADMPGILGPFEGGANHDEYGPAGDRSIKAMLDAPFYYAFPNGDFARVNDSGTGHLRYHRIYELAWAEYGDPKYAWLIDRRRSRSDEAPAHWSLWRPRGEPEGDFSDRAHSGRTAFRMKTGAMPDALPSSRTSWYLLIGR